jgi:hypothetical protein
VNKSWSVSRTIAVLGIGALTLGACGGGSSEPSAITVKSASEVVSAAAAAVEGASSFRTAGTMTINDSASGMSGVMPIDGITDAKNKTAAFSMDLGPLIQSAFEKEGVSESDVPAEMRDAGYKFEMRVIGSQAYMKMGILGSMLGGDSANKWIKIDPASMGLTEADLAQLGGGATSQMGLSYLKSISAENVTEVGKEQVRGVDTTHYKATASVDALLANTAESQRETQRKTMSDAGITSVPVEVWIDADGLTRRMRFDMQGSSAAFKGEVGVEFEFYDFNATPAVEAPPAAEVISVDEVPALKSALEQQSNATSRATEVPVVSAA